MSLALQARIVAILKADAGFTALCGARIYDHVPVSPAFPYAAFGPEFVTPFAADDMAGDDRIITIDVYDRATNGGRVGVKGAMAAIKAALHNDDGIPLSDGSHVVLAWLYDERIINEPDAYTVHGLMRFRYLIQP